MGGGIHSPACPGGLDWRTYMLKRKEDYEKETFIPRAGPGDVPGAGCPGNGGRDKEQRLHPHTAEFEAIQFCV